MEHSEWQILFQYQAHGRYIRSEYFPQNFLNQSHPQSSRASAIDHRLSQATNPCTTICHPLPISTLELLSHPDVIELTPICPSRLRIIRIPLPHFIHTTTSNIPFDHYTTPYCAETTATPPPKQQNNSQHASITALRPILCDGYSRHHPKYHHFLSAFC